MVSASAHLPSPAEVLPTFGGSEDPFRLLFRNPFTTAGTSGRSSFPRNPRRAEIIDSTGLRSRLHARCQGGGRVVPPISRASRGLRDGERRDVVGEVNLAGSDAGPDKDISVVGSLPNVPTRQAPPATETAAEETFFAPPPHSPLPAISSVPERRRPALVARRRRPLRPRIQLGLFILAILGGFALEVTPYGAFGYLVASDLIHAGSYARATLATVRDTERLLGADTYDAARSAADAAAAAHASLPRAKSLTAYAALVDFAISVRFGVDAQRRPRGKQLLEELPPKDAVHYRSAASAAQIADGGDVQRALGALAAASGSTRGDPAEVEMDVLQGDLQLAAKDAASALISFRRAVALADNARSHFGLARAHELQGDRTEASKEVAATLASSPDHPGALNPSSATCGFPRGRPRGEGSRPRARRPGASQGFADGTFQGVRASSDD